MKVVDIERVVILMRFIQFGWNEDRKKRFDDDLKMMLENQCEDLEEHDAKVRADVIEEFRTYLKTVVPCEMPQDIWNIGVDNTCDRMLKERE